MVVVVTAYDFESGRPGSNPEWGLICCMASIVAQGSPEPSDMCPPQILGETHIWGVNSMHFVMFFVFLVFFCRGGIWDSGGGIPQEIAGNNTRNNTGNNTRNNTRNNTGNNIIILVMFVRRPSSWHGNYMHQVTQNVKVNGIFYDFKWGPEPGV